MAMNGYNVMAGDYRVYGVPAETEGVRMAMNGYNVMAGECRVYGVPAETEGVRMAMNDKGTLVVLPYPQPLARLVQAVQINSMVFSLQANYTD
jgi:hypothetical protein